MKPPQGPHLARQPEAVRDETSPRAHGPDVHGACPWVMRGTCPWVMGHAWNLPMGHGSCVEPAHGSWVMRGTCPWVMGHAWNLPMGHGTCMEPAHGSWDVRGTCPWATTGNNIKVLTVLRNISLIIPSAFKPDVVSMSSTYFI